MKTRTIIIIALIAITITITVLVIVRKKKVQEKILRISDAIEKGAGALGTDVNSVLLNTSKDSHFSTSASDMALMHSTDADTIIKAFSGKTKGQIKTMMDQFKAKYGVDFNDYLNDVFDPWYWTYDTAAYNKVLNTISAAPAR